MTAHQATGLTALPDTVLHTIIGLLSRPSLKSLSLVNKRLCSLVTCSLFESLDLSAYSAQELVDLQADLLDDNKSRLYGHEFKSITCQIGQAACDDGKDALPLVVGAMLQVLRSIKAAGTLALDIALSTNGWDGESEDAILFFLEEVGNLAPSNIEAIKLSIDAYGSSECADDEDGHEDDCNLALDQISQILTTLPIAAVTHLHLIGARGDLKEALESISNLTQSPFLHSLELTGSTIVFSPPPALRTLSISWLEDGDLTDALAAAFKLVAASAGTLEWITLYNVNGLPLPDKPPATTMRLAKLLHLELADRNAGDGSLLDLVLHACEMPSLHYLNLDMLDIVSPDLSPLLSRLPSLKGLDLGEGMLRCQPEDPLSRDFWGFERTRDACKAGGIELKVTFTGELCETADDVADTLARVEVLSEHLVFLSLGITQEALASLSSAPGKFFPKLKSLYLALMPTGEFSDEADADVGGLDSVLRAFQAPGLDSLQVSISVALKMDYARAAIQVVGNGVFPSLPLIGRETLAEQLDGELAFEESVRGVNLRFERESTSIGFSSCDPDDGDDDESDQETAVDEQDLASSSLASDLESLKMTSPVSSLPSPAFSVSD